MTAGQTYRERPPQGPVASVVSSVWAQRVAHGAPVYHHRTVPNASAELVCAIGARPRIVGPRTGAVVEPLAPGTTVVGVRFRPGAAPAALGVPASELVDVELGLDELWGAAGVALGERVAAAPTTAAAAELLEAEVGARMGEGPDPVIAEAVRRLMPRRGRGVGDLPSALYVSERQLRRRCLEAVGLAPKPLQRMLRFQGFLALAQLGGRADLARLAAEAGFTDQSHLTHEALRLAGVSPATLLRESARHCGPAHDHRVSFAPLVRGLAA